MPPPPSTNHLRVSSEQRLGSSLSLGWSGRSRRRPTNNDDEASDANEHVPKSLSPKLPNPSASTALIQNLQKLIVYRTLNTPIFLGPPAVLANVLGAAAAGQNSHLLDGLSMFRVYGFKNLSSLRL